MAHSRLEKLDAFMSRLEKSQDRWMGGVVISRNGVVEFKRFIGYLSIEEGLKNNDKTKFRVGSVSKIFTAVMILQLVEEGKLSTDMRLSQFFPKIPFAEDITLLDMLGHASGIASFTDTSEYEQYMGSERSPEELLRIIEQLDPSFEPRTKRSYSNTNFVLLGFIIERIEGRGYADVLQMRIASKIELPDTTFGGAIVVKNNQAASYRFDEGSWLKHSETHMSIPHGAGAIVSTPSDLVVFMDALFNNKLISEASLGRMLSFQDKFGLGIKKNRLRGRKGLQWTSYGHGGTIDGFAAALEYFPDDKVVVALVANAVDREFRHPMECALARYFGTL